MNEEMNSVFSSHNATTTPSASAASSTQTAGTVAMATNNNETIVENKRRKRKIFGNSIKKNRVQNAQDITPMDSQSSHTTRESAQTATQVNNSVNHALVREQGLGAFNVLPDKLIVKLLRRLPVGDLMRLGGTSRAFYQFATWDGVWRKIALDKWMGDFEFRVNWRVTTLFPKSTMPIPEVFLPHGRKLIPGFYSEYMYQRWWEATQSGFLMSLDPEIPGHSPHGPPPILIERIMSKDITPAEFCERYLKTNRPVIITDVTPQWRAYATYLIGEEAQKVKQRMIKAQQQATGEVVPNMFILSDEEQSDSSSDESSDSETSEDSSEECSDDSDNESEDDEEEDDDDDEEEQIDNPYQWTPEKLAIRYKNTLFKVNSFTTDGKRVRMTMWDYVQYMKNNQDAHPLYIFDSGFGERAPDLLDDYTVPEYFWEDLFACLPAYGPRAIRPKYRWLVMGPARTGTPFHVDPNGTSAWNALLYGYKRWILYPPMPEGHAPPGVDPYSLKAPHALTWYLAIYPGLPKHQCPPMEFIQRPGDFLFVPSGWWHSVLNLTDTIAVTQNFVNMQNLDAVVNSFATSGNFKLLEFWKSQMLPMRPELVRIMDQKIQICKGHVMELKYAELKEKRRRERKQWKRREAQLLAEISQLKSQHQGNQNATTQAEPSAASKNGDTSQATNNVKEDVDKSAEDKPVNGTRGTEWTVVCDC